MNLKEQILQDLFQGETYLSGEAISRKYGVTRAAVWKVIRHLREDGYQVDSVKHHGYRLLPSTADRLSEMELNRLCQSDKLFDFVRKAAFYQDIDSTNLAARRLADDAAPDHTVVVAARQSTGRGRRGRRWLSMHEDGLWFSLLLRPEAEPAVLANLTLLAGLAVTLAIREATGLTAAIKWPNDVVILPEGKKVCGILTEMVVEDQTVMAVIIGIGLNIHTREFPDDLGQSATSLWLSSQRSWTRLAMLAAILKKWHTLYPDYLQALGAAPDETAADAAVKKGSEWLQLYKEHCATLGRPVVATSMDGTVLQGVATDILPDGDLVMLDSSGHERILRSGEVSVRGLVGYI